ncbi:MAG: hypothetical protein SGJ19_12635 [Planctomycetia bacterium]|nr:hypothetical protein [Planctomycetia bacterium]
MTAASNTIVSARGFAVEIGCAAVTVGALLAVGRTSAAISFWPALGLSLTGVVAVALTSPARGLRAQQLWRQARRWVALFIALLALQQFAADRLALTALWLPYGTALLLHVIARGNRGFAVAEKVEGAAPAKAIAANEPPSSMDDGDWRHHIEYAQSYDAAGLKQVAGVARLTFRPGERQTELHLAFCPSFAGAPRLDCQQTSGPEARVKITQKMPYGARAEVQRLDATAWSVITLEFIATPSIATLAKPNIKQAS